MRTRLVPLILLAALCAGQQPCSAGEPTEPEKREAAAACGSVNGVCPVMGKLVTPQGGAATYDGEKVAFCCPGCIERFQADPVRYMDVLRLDPPRYWFASTKPGVVALRKAKVAVGAANGRCPVMGRPVVPGGGSATYGGQRIAFCCPGCEPRFRQDPERYMRLMRADPLGYAYDRPGPTNEQLRAAREAVQASNGLCPVMKRLVTPAGGSVVHDGLRIAFCCPGCAETFEADSAAYMAAMRTERAVFGYVEPSR